MSDNEDREDKTGRWDALPPRTPLESLTTGHEVVPRSQAISEPGISKLDEATRYPA